MTDIIKDEELLTRNILYTGSTGYIGTVNNIDILGHTGCNDPCNLNDPFDKVRYNIMDLSIDDMNKRDSRGRTLLHQAVIYNRLKVMRFLLENNMDPNETDMDGKLPADLTTNPTILALLSEYEFPMKEPL